MRNYIAALVATIMIAPAVANAAVEYRYVTEYSAYYGEIGTQLSINLFIQETLTGTSQSIIAKDGGVFGAAIMVTNTNGGNAAIYGTAGDMKITPNLANTPIGFGPKATIIDQKPATATQTGLIVNADVIGGNGSDGPNVWFTTGPAVSRIHIGTIDITVGTTLTTYTLTNYGIGFNTVTQKATDLDFDGPGYIGASNPVGGFFTFDVAAVPEPSSMALCGLVACGMSYAGYRRRKIAVSAETPAV